MKQLVIDINAVVSNINIIKKSVEVPIIAVLKADGYGFGAQKMVDVLTAQGINFFAFTELSDAINARKNTNTHVDILLMRNIESKTDAKEIVENDIIAMISCDNDATILNETALEMDKKTRAHIKVNTGMNRYGFNQNISALKENYRNISFEGIYSHLNTASNPTEVKKQVDIFKKILLECSEYDFKCIHICNSYAALNYKNLHFSAVRLGSAFLGRVVGNYGFCKTSRVETSITQINNLEKGQSVGYSKKFTAKKNLKTAIIDIGFFDGFNVKVENQIFSAVDTLRYIYGNLKAFKKDLYVNVNGKKARVLGKVGLNNTIIDVTNIDCKVSDTVIVDVNPLYINGLSVGKVYENEK